MAVLVLAALLLWQSRSPATLANPAPMAVTLPAAPDPWTGRGSGCTEPDPTGTGGCVAPATAWLHAELTEAFGTQPATCWSEHAWNPSSDHPAGLGCDVFVGTAGEFPAGDDLVRGWTIAEWLRTHADALDVRYVIWQGRIWVDSRAQLGWAPYDGGGVYDPDDATGGHFDHVHVSLRR